jgi:hypothetical protein
MMLETALISRGYGTGYLSGGDLLTHRQRAAVFALSAQIMHRILAGAARARGSHKRGGGAVKANVDETSGSCARARFLTGGAGRGVGGVRQNRASSSKSSRVTLLSVGSAKRKSRRS